MWWKVWEVAMLTFENPAAFLFLLLIPLLFVLRALGLLRRISFPLTLSDWKGKSFAWKGAGRKIAAFIAQGLCLAGYVLLVIAFANPLLHHQEKVYTSKGTDILFVLDTSPSMAAKDIAGMTRLEAAKRGIHTMVNASRGASFGLVAMASEAAAVVPPTNDHDLFLQRLDSLIAGGLGEGSAIGVGLSSAVYHLISSSAPKKCIVLVTDGENNAGSIHPETAAMLAAENDITIYTFGIGTRGAVPIEYIEPESGRVRSGYYESDFDSGPLEDIASLAGGQYFGIESTLALADALSAVSQLQASVQTFYLRTADEHFWHLFLSAAGILLSAAWIFRRIFLGEVL